MTSNNVFPRTIYQEVKAWIAQQEAFEAEHNEPAPLTPVQQQALETLRLVPPAPLPEQLNYIGILNEFSQTHLWVGKILYTPGGEPQSWTCSVSTGWILDHRPDGIDSFPAPGYGLGDNGQVPAFAAKKTAKSHAARCAVDWLVASGKMARQFALAHPSPDGTPAGGVEVQEQGRAVAPAASAPAPPAPPAPAMREGEGKPEKKEEQQQEQEEEEEEEEEEEDEPLVGEETPGGVPLKRPSSASATATTSPPPPPPKRLQSAAATATITSATISNPTPGNGGGGGYGNGDVNVPVSPPATGSVASLCSELNMPAPGYMIAESKVGAGLFDAWPEFDDYGDDELIGLREAATIRDHPGRTGLRQAVAGRLLSPLRAIKAKRDAQFASLQEKLGRDC